MFKHSSIIRMETFSDRLITATHEESRNKVLLSPLSIVEPSDHHRVPQGIHLAAAVVHHSGEPGVHSFGTVAVAVAQQLLVDAAPAGNRTEGKTLTLTITEQLQSHLWVSSSLHHLFDDLLQVLVVGIVSWSSQDGAAVHLQKDTDHKLSTKGLFAVQLVPGC